MFDGRWKDRMSYIMLTLRNSLDRMVTKGDGAVTVPIYSDTAVEEVLQKQVLTVPTMMRCDMFHYWKQIMKVT